MRLIDADKLKDRFLSLRYLYNEHDLCPWQTVDEAPTIGSWISVEDRLPEKSGTYLCYQPKAASICALNTVRWSEAKGHWMGKEVGSRIEGIEYWMPLPELPEVELCD